ncbi:MerR family transcriptional regulator [Epidermidibacterium keratini]|uniref:MerR family transcriptional regulator n=1 Tax=Epidermidibacterium keratini TaxID=1891644 RepID=A0A7L4YRR4_9ACTN|nr:MerR family transcriptional regulator [Epidermidibacterium keratini]QHC01247.1 MerR family transcriptional regulator [Epidermidibacterium keratini]
MDDTETLRIADLARETGLSKDTLRWYEAEGLIPAVPRDGAGRRVYDERSVRMVELLVKLRRTGMPVKAMREFVRLVAEGAVSHGQRMTLLTEHREEVLVRLREMLADLDAIEAKIAHYRSLIDDGLDCEGAPVDEATARLQRRLSMEEDDNE